MGSKGLVGRAWIRGRGGWGGQGGGRGSGPHRKITRYMGRSRSIPLLPLTKFPGSAHGGGGGAIHFTGMH